jgi:5-methylcytosine-specific restriction endonuclease McrA
VYIRDKDTCQHCGKYVQWCDRHASHVIPVSRDGRLAMDPLNMKVLCYHCHLNRRHKHPIEAGEWYTKKFPDRWEILQERYRDGGKWSISLTWLEESLENNKEYLKSLEKNL